MMKGRKNMAGKALDPHLWNLENLFKCMYDVPVYQRPYSWDKEQVEVLLNDIIEAYQSDSKDEDIILAILLSMTKMIRLTD